MISRRFVTLGAPLTLCSAWLLLSVESALGQWSIPGELQAQASVLTREQLEFITSGAILEFIPERQLEHELATRDAASLRSLMNDLMSLADRIRYDPEQDLGAAPLNLTSKSFNAAMPTPAPLRDFERARGRERPRRLFRLDRRE